MGFKLPLLLVFCCSLVAAQSNYSFPDDFMLGVATAAYQIEGATSEDGKSENIWDYLIRTNPSFISNNATAEVACDSYHKYKEDVALLAYLGVSHYRFSISWSRILSTLYQNEPNLAGIKYYQNLVDELLAYNITPVATMYHWDLPQSLQDIGGWMNNAMVDHFANYARTLYTYLPGVAHWVTFNEPHTVCKFGYSMGANAPAIRQPGIAEYTCSYILLKSHAAAYHVLKDEFPELTGKISIALDAHWSEPASNSTEDIEAADRRLQFEHGLFGNVLVNGNWPQIVIDRVNYRSEMENFTKSRLPVFTEEESNMIKGSFDYYSVNYYTSTNVSDSEEASFESVSYDNDMRVSSTMEGGGGGGGGGGFGPGGDAPGGEGGGGSGAGGDVPGGGSGAGGDVPGGESGLGPNTFNQATTFEGGAVSSSWAMRKSLNWIREQYGDLEIFIMESGTGGSTGLMDNVRITFMQDYLSVVLEMIHEDNLKLLGYTFWSLLDNFQWQNGYSQAFGIYQVDFDDENRTRTARLSVDYYKKLIATRVIADN